MRNGIIFIVIFTLLSITYPGEEVYSEDTYQTIPDEAIRLRILANSDNERDQEIKRMVRDDVNHYINNLVQYMDDIEEARQVIREHIPTIEDIVADTLIQEGIAEDYKVEYREDVSFPTKIYDHLIYPAGEYEAVLISIGEAKGANWWCVLFPPLCFLDFSNGTTVNESVEEGKTEEIIEEEDKEEALQDDVEVNFFLFEWLGWT